MPIPSFNLILYPFLQNIGKHGEVNMNVSIEELEDHFGLTVEERKQLLPSGNAVVFKNRVRFARLHLIKAGLIESKQRGFVNITDAGKKVINENPNFDNVKYLEKFPSYQEFKSKLKKNQAEKKKLKDDENNKSLEEAVDNQTNEEAFEFAYEKLKEETSLELKEKLENCTWGFFEKLVIDLLLRMGYGGSRKDAGKAFAKTNDEGIDGIIKEDKLGLDIIYVQAKKWNSDRTVSRPEIQKFAGALQGQRARKGIFITTARFTKGAVDYTKVIDTKIVLIDGDELVDLMMENNLGVSVLSTYEVKKIDIDYFIED